MVDADTNKTYKPIYDIVDFEGKKVYQEDISMFPSPCTVNQRVIEYGEKIQELNAEKIENEGIETAFADGTKTHSQEKGLDKNEINVVLGMKMIKKSFSEQKPMNHGIRSQKKCEVQKQLPTKQFFVGMLRKK